MRFVTIFLYLLVCCLLFIISLLTMLVLVQGLVVKDYLRINFKSCPRAMSLVSNDADAFRDDFYLFIISIMSVIPCPGPCR